MKEINISAILVSKRKEKGITQDELAAYLGISKAAISKWETGQSYPDITLLPLLAAYFNISIDKLIGYKPQMVKEDIKKLYFRLCDDFASKPFEEVMEECEKIIRKYYACVPLIIQMGLLLMNHYSLVRDPDKIRKIQIEIRDLFRHAKEITDDRYLIKEAVYLEAYNEIMLNNPGEAMILLEDCTRASFSEENLLAASYEMLGKKEKAIETLQVAVYQKMMDIMGIQAGLAKLYGNQSEKVDMWIKSFFEMSDVFKIEKMHPGGICSLYLSFAQSYMVQGRKDEALEMVEKYANTVTGDIFPLKLGGNEFFDQIDGWLQELELGTKMPRSEELVRNSMAEALGQIPELAGLASEPRFQNIVKRMRSKLLGE